VLEDTLLETVRNRSIKPVETILRKGGVSPNSKDVDGRAALSRAATNGHEAVVTLTANTIEQDLSRSCNLRLNLLIVQASQKQDVPRRNRVHRRLVVRDSRKSIYEARAPRGILIGLEYLCCDLFVIFSPFLTRTGFVNVEGAASRS
jgi:hypothetical protein